MDNECAMPRLHRQPEDILSELLVLQAQSGSKNALSQLVDIWTPRLKARLTRDPDGSLEVVQEAWIGIAKGLRSLKDPARFGPWAIQIVHHKAADWIKARSRQRSLETHLPKNASHPETQEDHAQRIREAISHLEPKLRDVVYLFYMDTCTLKQTAPVLNIPVGTAKTRLARARNQLKHLLERSTQ